MGKYLSYFIAKSNIKSLYNLIISFSHDFPENDKQELLDKILEIDLQKIISSISGLDKDMYKLIIYIMEDKMLIKAKNKIDEQRREIIRTYDRYKDGGFSMGPRYYQVIIHELFNVFSFYNNNYIIKDEFTEFQNVMKNGFETLLINYATDDNYPDKIRQIDEHLFKLFVLYGNADDFQKVTSKYGITKLEVNNEDIPTIVDWVNNLITSIFQQVKFFGSSPNRHIEIQLHNLYFADRIRKYINNMSLISSGINIPLEFHENLAQNIIGLLEVEDILNSGSLKNLLAFISNISKGISFQSLSKLIEISAEKEKYIQDKNYFLTISDFIHTNYLEKKIENPKLVSRILNLSGSDNHFLYLWKISSEQNKKLIEEQLRDNLNTRFNFYDFMNATYEGVLHYSDYLSKFIEEAKQYAAEPLKWDGIKPNQLNLIFINLVIFIYKLQIPFNNPLLKSLKKVPPHWNFYLNPNTFDYSQFDYRWLLLVEYEGVYVGLQKIKPLKLSIKKALKREYIKEIAEIYVKYFL